MPRKPRRVGNRITLLAAVLFWIVAPWTQAADPSQSGDSLRGGFVDPPHEARPSTYWLWLNGYVNRDHVESELRAFHDAGIRGVCLFDMGARGAKDGMPPAGPAFLSEESVADIAHAVKIAGRLGLDVQLSVASSWDMGGSWVEPRHASMGLFTSELAVEGPKELDQVLPFPELPPKAPRLSDGRPAYSKEVAVLALPAGRRLPGHDFVFRLDPPGIHTLDHAVLYNTSSGDAKTYGDLHLYAKDFSIAVSMTGTNPASFREVLRESLRPTTDPQRFDLPSVEARYARLRILSGHNPRFERVQLGELELIDVEGVNVVASHAADRSRDGADLIGYVSALGQDGSWTAANIHDGAKSGPGGSWSSAGPPPVLVENPDAVVDLTDRIGSDGRLRWSVPAGQWILLRLVCGNTGERLKVPSPASDGLATDHLSAEATRAFLETLIGRLQTKLGNLADTALKQLYLASYEVRGRIWTPALPEKFHHYRGYEITPYLPALSGIVIGSDEITQRFLYDYRKTLGDLLVDAYYREAVQAAHAVGLGIESEAGGPGPPIHQVPVDALKAQGSIDEIRGEFWPKRPEAARLWVVKETACAAHIYGKRRVHMEAFTSMHHWQDGPFDLKPSADRALCEGANHFVWHTASHLPPEAGKPGWVYGAGTHLNTQIIWWPKSKSFLDYLARCSFLLQRGLFVADVCYYYGDQGYNFVPPKHVDPSLGFGFDYDVVNREVLLDRMSVRDGRLALPDGMSYEILVLPDRDDIDLDVLGKLETLVRNGATVVGPKPSRSGGLTEYPKRDEKVQEIAERLWGPCDGATVLEHELGRGRFVWGRSLRDVLRRRGAGPDLSYSSDRADTALDFIHRRTDDAEIYFVRNQLPRWERVEATFRVVDRAPELWEPDTGRMEPQPVLRRDDGGTSLALELAPYGSVFVVFRPGSSRVVTDVRRPAEREDDPLPAPRDLAGPWELTFSGGPRSPSATRFETLTPWNEHSDDTVRFFSGIGRYECTFELPASWLTNDRRVRLDLGELWAVGEVFVNQRSIGVLWKPPLVVDITSAARAGVNRLAVEVATTWSNRLVGDARLPKEERVTRTNITSTNGRAWKDVPLLRSGLFGPVRLVPARAKSP